MSLLISTCRNVHHSLFLLLSFLLFAGLLYGVHDPTMIYDGSYAYVYSTGDGVHIRRSSDLQNWDYMGSVLSSNLPWVETKISGVTALWAPDITYHNGLYYLCYSASTFGSQISLIGLLSNETLDPFDPDYKWIDEGEIIDSPQSWSRDYPDYPAYNAIDGTFVRDENSDMWLVFGSWWDGIMLTPLDNGTLKPTTSPPTIYNVAHRTYHVGLEAAYITYREPYYYLFVNWDRCCSGVNSTYTIRVGRSDDITGPYYDKDGVSLLNSGGTIFVASNGRWIGPGHATITEIEGQEYFSYHAYDELDNGAAILCINELSWDQDLWPVLGDYVYPDPPDPIVPPTGPTIAYWDFEDGTAGASFVSGGSAQVGTEDLSINNHDMYAWNNSPWYNSESPSFSATGETPTGIGLSARFDGGQNGYTVDGSVNSWAPTEWTIEMAVKLDNLSGWQTMIGRNGSSLGVHEADFYFQKNNDTSEPGDLEDRFRINFGTVGGQRYILDSDFVVVPGQWYYLAAVSDGNDLTMYADKLDGNGSQVVGTMELNADNDNALAAPSLGYAWTIGRGWYGKDSGENAVDQMTGNLDDIRFTNRALSPSEFLNYQCGAWGYLDNDLNFNCWVDYPDFAILSADWDGTLAVLGDFASEWLMTTQPYVDGAVNMLY